MTKLMQDALTDFISLAENEIKAIETGEAPGPRMRDIVGQWKATVREAKQAHSGGEAMTTLYNCHNRWRSIPNHQVRLLR